MSSNFFSATTGRSRDRAVMGPEIDPPARIEARPQVSVAIFVRALAGQEPGAASLKTA